MATPIDFKFTEPTTDAVTHTVATKDALTDATWTVVPHLYATKVTPQILSSGYQTAVLHYRYGRGVLQAGETAVANYAKLDIETKFVRIEIAQPAGFTPVFWYGYVLNARDSRGKVEEVLPGPPIQYGVVSGIQVFQCVSFDYFFDRRQMDYSIHFDGKKINRKMTFNGGRTGQLDPNYLPRGNRHKYENPAQDLNNPAVFDDPYVTAGTGATSDEWTASRIAEHILAWHYPRDANDVKKPCEYELSERAKSILSEYKPVINPGNSTPLGVLRRLFNPRRGIVGWVTYDNPTNTCFFDADTMLVGNLALPGGGTLPANTNQRTWNFDQNIQFKQPEIAKPLRRRYQRIRTRGARRQACFTISLDAATVEVGWSAADQTDYNDGAKNDAGLLPAYGGLTVKQKAERNDAFRRDERLAHVYASFLIPPTWDGKSNDGTSAGAFDFACPKDDGGPNAGEALRLSSFRLLNKLPLLEGFDYSTNPGSPTKTGKQDQPDQMKPFGVVPVGDARVQYTHKMNNANFETSGTNVKDAKSYQLSMQQQLPGLTMLATAGMNHTLAGPAFNIGVNAEPSNTPSEISYADVIWTVCGEWDAFAEAVYPAIPATAPILEELVIDVGDNYRLDWLAANTVIRVEDGKKVIAATGGPVRDDRPALQDLAALAYQWYETNRASMNVGVEAIRNAVQLGALITEIGANGATETVNTPITQIIYDLARSEMTVRTATAELDVRGIGAET